MRLLLVFMLVMVLWGIRSARADRPVKPWGVLVAAAVISLGYLSQRVI